MKEINLFILNSDKEVVGVLANSMPYSLPFFDDLRTINIDDYTNTLTFKSPANHKVATLLTTSNYILYPNKDNSTTLYKIMEVVEENNSGIISKDVYCEVSAQDDLIKDVIRPTKFIDSKVSDVLTHILSETDWQIGNLGDFSNVTIEYSDYPTKLAALVDLVTAIGGELMFEYDRKGNSSIIEQNVSIYEKLGEETGVFFTYGKDILGVKRTEDNTKLVTAMIGVGKSDGEGTPVTLTGHTSSSLGTLPTGYVKPTASDYIYSTKALETYSPNGKHFFGVYKDDNAKSPTELFKNTLAALQEYEKPLMTYEVSLALLSSIADLKSKEINLGDTILIQDKTLTPILTVSARVRELSTSLSNPLNDSVVLGDYIPLTPTINKKVLELQSTIRNSEEQWNKANEKSNEALKIVTDSASIWDTVTEKADKTEVEEIKKEVISIRLEITSTNGNIFKNGNIATDLRATVYRGVTDITELIPVTSFIWTRTSLDTVGDKVFNDKYKGGAKAITITEVDVDVKATFTCSLQEF